MTGKLQEKMLGKLVVLAVLAGGVLVGLRLRSPPPPLPAAVDGFFGPGARKADDVAVKKISITVPDAMLQDLNTRLDMTKFVTPLEGANFNYGYNGEALKKVHEYWRHKYDWRKAEAQINSFDHFTTEIEGLAIHFIHSKPQHRAGKTVVPLLLVHGWPGSVYEFYKVPRPRELGCQPVKCAFELIPMLTAPSSGDVAFEVIAPSIPGYAWSQAPSKMRFGTVACARVFAKLMRRLGYKTYFLQGGDWGSIIVTNLAKAFPKEVLGVHVNMPSAGVQRHDPMLLLKQVVGAWFPSLAGIAASDVDKFYPFIPNFMHILQESGYFHIQTTKPDTAGMGLLNSPMGLAAWIMEKFSTWTNKTYVDLPDGGMTAHFTMDELLTNVMIYWVTGSIATSQRFYKECFREPEFSDYEQQVVSVPAGFATCPEELGKAPLAFLRHSHSDIRRYTDVPRCGHFAAFQEPEVIAKEIFGFVSDVRRPKEKNGKEL